MKKIEISENLCFTLVIMALFAVIAIFGLSSCTPIDIDEAMPFYNHK